MTNPIELIARSLSADVAALDVISQNVANLRTPGFRAERLFGGLLSAQSGSDVQLDLADGGLDNTGRTEDLALRGDGFFVVDAGTGPMLERNGAFHLDADRRLVDAAGRAVQGEEGDIVIDGPSFKVDADGSVKVDGNVVDKLRIVSVGDPAMVKEAGTGLYSYSGSESEWLGQVRQGALEQANVDPGSEMVKLMDVTRHAQSVRRAIQAYDEALQNGINHLGDNA